MKGVVFTEFLEMVEDRFSADVADTILDTTHLPSGGVYTAVGTYDHAEIVALVTRLSEVVGIAVPDLLKAFGGYLLGRFATTYPQFFDDASSSFDLLGRVEGLIHVEVRKLYPDAELPSFETRETDGVLSMIYRSPRKMADLAEGLIRGCGNHYGEQLELEREDLSGTGTEVRFTIRRTNGSGE